MSTTKPDRSGKDLARYYTVPEVAQIWRCSIKAVYALVRDRERPDPFPLPLQDGKAYLFPIEEVDAWLAQRPRGLRESGESHPARVTSATVTVLPDRPAMVTKPYVRRCHRTAA